MTKSDVVIGDLDVRGGMLGVHRIDRVAAAHEHVAVDGDVVDGAEVRHDLDRRIGVGHRGIGRRRVVDVVLADDDRPGRAVDRDRIGMRAALVAGTREVVLLDGAADGVDGVRGQVEELVVADRRRTLVAVDDVGVRVVGLRPSKVLNSTTRPEALPVW